MGRTIHCWIQGQWNSYNKKRTRKNQKRMLAKAQGTQGIKCTDNRKATDKRKIKHALRRMDGSVLEGTICKQFVSNAKNRKNLKPCRGFKSFRSLAFRIQFLKNRIFGSSNPSTRRKIENGSMEIRKKLGAKKAEKSLEISAFLVFSRSDLNRPKDLAGAEGLEPTTPSFGDWCSTD